MVATTTRQPIVTKRHEARGVEAKAEHLRERGRGIVIERRVDERREGDGWLPVQRFSPEDDADVIDDSPLIHSSSKG